MRVLVLIAIVATACAAQSDPATIVLKAKRVWVSPTTVRENAALVIERGVLTAIDTSGKQEWPAGAEVLEFPEGSVTAGLVLASWRPPAGSDDPVDAVTPNAIGAEVPDPFEPQPKLTRGGITIAGVAPGSERLVTGQGSAVRIGGPVDLFVLKRSCSLRVNVGEGPRRTPDRFKPPVLPGPDDPLPPAMPQAPKSRGGAIAELRSLLERAAAVKGDPAWHPHEGETDLRPFLRVLDGGLPLRVAADRQADIARAIDLARAFRLRVVIEGGNEAWKLASELKAIDAAVMLRATSLPPVGSSAAAPLFRPAGEGHPDSAAILKAAGVPIAIVPPTDAEAGNLLYHAVRAIGPGFAWSDALSAITLGAAKILGVDADAGTLTTGRRADLAVWPGDPLETSARPVLVVSGGRVAHRVKPRADLVAITVKRAHTCAGDAIERATVLVEGGKIRAIGQRVTIPHDARRVVDAEAVLVPGFIDGGGQVGIRGYQATGEDAIELAPPVGPLGMEQSLAKAFDGDLPSVAAVAQAGVTSVALLPRAGRITSGVVPVVKTGGPAKDRVARPVGGILFDLTGSPANDATRKQLDTIIEGGKKYADSFAEHEKALAEWKKGVKTAPAAREKLEGPKAPKPRDPVSGTWVGKVSAEGMPPIEFTLTVKLDGTAVTGTIKLSFGGRDRENSFHGTFENGVLKAQTSEGRLQIEVEATVGRDVMSGTVKLARMGEAQFTATRTEKPAGADDGKPAEDKKDDGKKADADDGRPKPPKTQPALEPYRELFADRASAFVACPTEALAEIAIEAFRTKYEVRMVLLSTDEIVTLAPRLGAAGAALAPTGASIREEEGLLVNPALIAVQNKVPVLFRSGAEGDPRSLYQIAEAAVRDGVDPEDALRMITRQPARFLGMLDRAGSLERGKDADLVLLSGEPFAPGTRVKRVMINGSFTDEERAP